MATADDLIQTFQRKLPALDPNTRYIARVRAFSQLGIPSDWSEALVIDTPSDSSVPTAPTNLRINFDSGTLFLDWDPPVHNTDGTIVTDLARYRVTLSDGTTTVAYFTTNSFFSYSFETNQADFGQAQPELNVAVYAIDVSGNSSSPRTGLAINAPPTDPPNAPDLSAAFTIINVSMSPHPVDEDITSYLLYSSTNGTDFSLLAETGSNFSHDVEEGETHYYRFKTKDIFGQESENYSPIASVTTRDLAQEALEPPNQPQDLAGLAGIDSVTRRPYIDVTWTPNSGDSMLAYYQLVVENDDTSVVRFYDIPRQESSFRIENLEEDTTYNIILYAVSPAGIRSDASDEVSVTTGHYTGAPDPPTGMGAVTGIGTITLFWDPHPDSFFHVFEVYASTDSDDLYSTPDPDTLVFVGNTTSYVHPADQGEQWFFRIRAVNTFGNASSFAPASANDWTATIPLDVLPGIPENVDTGSDIEIGTTGDNVYIDVTWDEVEQGDIAGYVIRLNVTSLTNYSYQNVIGSDTLSVRFNGLAAATSYDVAVASFDTSGRYSDFSSPVVEVTPGDHTAPSDITNVLARGSVRSILLEWDAVTDADFDHYEIHIGTTEGFTPDSENLYDSPGVGTIALIEKYWDDVSEEWKDLVALERYYVKMRAVDRSGNASNYVEAIDARDSNEKGTVVGQVGDNDIEELVVDKLISGDLTAAIALLGSIKTASSGPRLEIDSSGIRGYGSDGTSVNLHYTTVEDVGAGLDAGDLKISGALTAGSSITIGSSSNVFKVDSSGKMWFGDEDFADAPFRVDNDGSVVAGDILITGNGSAPTDPLINSTNFVVTQAGNVTANNITANGGLIGGATINPTVVTLTSGSTNIPSGGLSGGTITVDSVTGFSSSGVLAIGGYAFTYTGVNTGTNTFTGVSGGVEGTIPDDTPVYQGGLTGGLLQAPNILITSGGGIQFTGDGNITWSETSAGKIIVGGLGAIQSGNYDSGTGWQLGPDGLIIHDGIIEGADIRIGVSSENLFVNGSFEDGTDSATGWNEYDPNATVTYEVTDEESLFQSESQKLTVTAVTGSARAGLYQDLTPFDGVFKEDTPVAISIYVKQTVGTLRSVKIFVVTVDPDDQSETTVWNGNDLGGQSTDIDSLDQWQRIQTVFKLTDDYENLRVYFWINDVDENDEFYFDGAQFQLSSFVTDFAPRTLEIPSSYIQDAHISTLTADKIRSGYIGPVSAGGSVDIVLGPDGKITSIDLDNTTGWELARDGALFQNGSITILADGDDGDAGGFVKLDGSGLKLAYGSDTKFLVDSSGVYIGGDDTTTANVYFDGSKVVFAAGDSGYEFTIDTDGITDPTGNEEDRVLQLKDGTDAENFYLTKDGKAYFRGGVISLGGGVGFNVDNTGNLWVGHESLASAPFAIYASDEIYLRSKSINVSNDAGAYIQSVGYDPGEEGWIIKGDGTAEFNDVVVRGEVHASSGTFSGELSAATGTFAGELSAATGTFSGSLNAASGTFTGTLNGVDGTFTGTITGSTIIGGTFRTSSGVPRIEMSSGLANTISFISSGGISTISATIGGLDINPPFSGSIKMGNTSFLGDVFFSGSVIGLPSTDPASGETGAASVLVPTGPSIGSTAVTNAGTTSQFNPVGSSVDPHTHITSHSHSLNSHTHSLNSHTHSLNNHTHTFS